MLRKILLVLAILNILGCAKRYSTPFSPRPLEEVKFLDRAQTKSSNGITVTTAVLSPKESREVFAVDLESEGIQPVWVNVENKTNKSFLLLPISLDPEYFSPGEVAFLFRSGFSKSEAKMLDKHLRAKGLSIELVPAQGAVSGFVFTNIDPGVKYVRILLTHLTDAETEDFSFYFEVPGVQPDYKPVDHKSLYSEKEMINYQDEQELRHALGRLPCCTTNRKGTRNRYPINFIFIGERDDVFAALLRRGWDIAESLSETSNIDKEALIATGRYRTLPMSNYYFYGRRHDYGFQKSRLVKGGSLRQGVQIRLWLSPMRFNGKDLWLGSINNLLGSNLKGKELTSSEIVDPDVDEAREFLLEDMVLSEGVSKIGSFIGIEPASIDNPHMDVLDQPWWTDGFRVVFLFEHEPHSLEDIDFFTWGEEESVRAEKSYN